MKLTAFLLFAFVATVSAHRERYSSEKDYLRLAKPFTSGNVYRFRYDSQISSGLGSMDASVTGEQKSTHRFSAMVNVNFETDRSATLHLEDIRIASLNGELPELRRVQSLQLFEEETIESQKLEQLQMSCTFEYSEGVIERVYYNAKDDVWSKNIKRAILNLVQLNLKERDNNQENMQIDSSELSLSKMFTVNETTVEGKCEVVYSVSKVANNNVEDRQVYNVTKAIDFK
uniref:Vitellogenin domain-containing protein n=1 Tax=Panagrolaimus sp. ES5 TaxID=591445 RepID=A0AC34G881_9BILA